jgi:hypothetical protein
MGEGRRPARPSPADKIRAGTVLPETIATAGRDAAIIDPMVPEARLVELLEHGAGQAPEKLSMSSAGLVVGAENLIRLIW